MKLLEDEEVVLVNSDTIDITEIVEKSNNFNLTY